MGARAGGSRAGDLLVVLPALDEARNLPAVLEELRCALPGAARLVVDDGSRDATVKVAREGGAGVLLLPFHLGYGAAVQAGIKLGLRRRFPVVVTFDADGQHDPADITPLADAVRAGADLVIGSRALAPDSYQGGFARRRGRSLFALLAYVIVALGGFGSIPGSLVAGILIGVIEVLAGLLIAPAFKYVAVFAIYLVVVLIRPQGLFGKF